MTEATIKKPKLAVRLAQQIAQEIVEQGWCAGHLIGKEPELLAKYKVSRDPMREAVRILEWQGVAKSVQGAGGGLQVGASGVDAVSNLLRDYLMLNDTAAADIIVANRAFNTLVVKLLSSQLDQRGVESLRALTQERKFLHGSQQQEKQHLLAVFFEMAKLTQNPALILFMAPLNEILMNYTHGIALDEREFIKGGKQAWSLINRCVEAIVSGDDTNATVAMWAYQDLMDKTITDILSLKRQGELKLNANLPMWVTDEGKKKAQRFVYELHFDIRQRQLNSGDRIGQELELIEQYQVSRSIFREAIRMLEIIGVVEHRKGRDGGLFLSVPEPTGIIAPIIVCLRQADFDFEKLNVARTTIEVLTAQLAAENINADQLAALALLLKNQDDALALAYIDSAANLHRYISKIAGNQVFELYLDVLTQLSVFRPQSGARLDKVIANTPKMKELHRLLVVAISQQDPQLACRAMINQRALAAKLLG